MLSSTYLHRNISPVLLLILDVQQRTDDLQKRICIRFQGRTFVTGPEQSHAAASPQNMKFSVVDEEVRTGRAHAEITHPFLLVPAVRLLTLSGAHPMSTSSTLLGTFAHPF